MPRSRRKFWLPVLGFLGLAVVAVLSLLAYLLLTIPDTDSQVRPTRPALSLPAAAPPTNTPGPPLPVKELFKVEEAPEGFVDCDGYGFNGTVTAHNGQHLAGVQVVVWENQTGLVALGTTDDDGNYLIEIQDKPGQPQLWVQIYQDDLPVSAPVSVQIHLDCHSGSQVYQINWQELPEE
jgi:hypothetical protein